MAERIIVLVSCGSKEQAEHIAEAVVRERLAACVNVLPGVSSCYTWEGRLAWADETLCVMKTTRDRYPELEARVKALHSYDVPEIVSLNLEQSFGPYAAWIDDSVR